MSIGQHKIILKRKAEDDISPLCYCGLDSKEQFMFVCENCKRFVHIGCLKSERPSQLLGDVYFHFTCESCSPQFQESFSRVNLPWTYVLLVSLYNLHVQASSNCGFFKWRTQICAFIEKNWSVFFGSTRKKTSTWPGTVAGTLSINSPDLFKSGTQELGQPGWWALSSLNLPSLDELMQSQRTSKPPRRKKATETAVLLDTNVGLRHRSSKSSIQAAIELKEKRSILMEAKEIRQNRVISNTEKTTCKTEVCDWSTSGESSSQGSQPKNSWDYLLLDVKGEPEEPMVEIVEEEVVTDLSVNVEETVVPIKTEVTAGISDLQELPTDCLIGEMVDWTLPVQDVEGVEDVLDDQDIGLNIDVESENSHFLQEQTLETADLLHFNVADLDMQADNCVSDAESTSSRCSAKSATDAPPKERKIKDTTCLADPTEPKYIFMTEYDEHQLLKRLEQLSCAVKGNVTAKRLRRKLLVRQKQREGNQPLFDLDEQFKTLTGLISQEPSVPQPPRLLKSLAYPLDRYQLVSTSSAQGRTHRSFVTRLMGFEDEHLESVISPYTMRTLKPFIFRDYESVPPKMKLLHDIQHYHKSRDPDWEKPTRYPLDFCYVRPNHIPVINNLCQDFFWPGIELSECLQYPDFSCVVLYRKVIVGFAFMVPDIKYNEVYISFIFTHPEWRNAGIATFMIYHLIQTCMGKDVTLHVSVTNPALFLYQKFGFKVEELILNFYDKYLPVRSKECRHALFMRLSR